MAVTIGTYNTRGASGWSVFTLPARVFYVSDAYGNDSNTGAVPTNTIGIGPFKTTLKAYTACYNLGNNAAYWILLRRGDTFDGQTLTNDVNGDNDLFGPSGNPLLFSCYDENFTVNTSTGDGVNPAGSSRARPRITPTLGHGAYGGLTAGSLFTGGDWTALVGLHFYNKFADPASPAYAANSGGTAIAMPKPNNWGLVEDCLINYFSVGVDCPSGPLITVRRNVIHDCPGQGIHGGAPNWFVDENIVVRCGLADLTHDHNFYMDGAVRKGDLTSRGGNMTMRGNLSSGGGNGNNFRSGAYIDNNCYLSQNGGQNIGCPFSGVANFVTNNVWLELDASGLGELKWTLLPNIYGGATASNRGSMTISGNICSKSVSTNISSFDLDPGVDRTTLSNNIFYKWGAASPPPALPIQSYSGSLAWGGLTITVSGSGYADKSTTISAAVREAASPDIPGGAVIITVGSTADFNGAIDSVGAGATSCYISGITGTSGFGTALNGKVWKCSIYDSATNKVILYGTESVPGAYTSGGTAYTPYRQCSLTNVSSSGSGATVDIIVAGGQVVGFDYEGSEGPAGDNYMTPGVLYAVNDTVRSSTLNSSAHGGTDGGFLAVINRVALNVIEGASLSVNGSTGLITPTGGTNIMDPTGSFIDAHPSTYPHPNRTSGTYVDLIKGTTGSTQADFIAGALANAKNNSNQLYTPASLNDYIREGFGQTLVGSAYSDSLGTRLPLSASLGTLSLSGKPVNLTYSGMVAQPMVVHLRYRKKA